jgi:HPt (histidine-containing phosphotransfer) domain-containing protein
MHMTDTSVLDPEAIETLRSLSPDPDGSFLKELIDIYRQDTPARIEEAEAALARGDANTLVRAAHTIKGSSGNFGARTFARLAWEIESHAKTSNFTAAAEIFPAFKNEYAKVVGALEELTHTL